jgi:hypothetical protein
MHSEELLNASLHLLRDGDGGNVLVRGCAVRSLLACRQELLWRVFVLNNPRYKDGTVLVVGPQFGIGSSREHALFVQDLARVRGDLYDVVGRRVARLFDQTLHPAGPTLVNERPVCMAGAPGTMRLDLGPFASGIYLLRVHTPIAEQTVRIIHVR